MLEGILGLLSRTFWFLRLQQEALEWVCAQSVLLYLAEQEKNEPKVYRLKVVCSLQNR